MNRDQAMAKVRKLLAIGTDGRGNMTEAETAMRHAGKLMREYQIDTVADVMNDLKSDYAMVCGMEPVTQALDLLEPFEMCPAWVGIIALGCGRFTTVKVDLVGSDAGTLIRFSGYAPDVMYCRWLYKYLIERVDMLLAKLPKHVNNHASFRFGAAISIQNRLFIMHDEQNKIDKAEAKDGMSTALMIINAKAVAVANKFGAQDANTVETKNKMKDAEQIMGAKFGDTLAIPTSRPVETDSKKVKLVK